MTRASTERTIRFTCFCSGVSMRLVAWAPAVMRLAKLSMPTFMVW